MYWSAGALKEKEVELWSATKKGLERWSAVTPGRAPLESLLETTCEMQHTIIILFATICGKYL